MSLSNITISGTLKKDPEKRFTPSNIPVANLLIEVFYVPRGSSQSQEKIASQIIKINAWRDLAEDCEKNLKTGDKILVIGRLQINAYTNNEGKKKREVEIDANSISLLSDVVPVRSQREKKTSNESSKNVEETTFDELMSSTEEIPF